MAVSQPYRSDIDGLRAIAVLSVMFFHAGVSPFGGGFTGVDVFFAISGFLIGGHIYAERLAGKFTFAGFYRRRARRILPALFVVLVATLVMGCLLLSPLELRSLATEGMAALLSASNMYYWHVSGYFAVNSGLRPLLMTWSLGVEEQFYIFAPILMVALMRSRRLLLAVVASISLLSFGVACYQVAHHPAVAFYLLPGRAWELFAGVLLALLLTGRSERAEASAPWSRLTREVCAVAGLTMLLVPVFSFRLTTPFPGAGALPSIAGTLLLLFTKDSWTNRVLLSIRPLREVGKISYSLYLWHWPLLSLAAILLGRRAQPPVAAVLLCVAAVLSLASYRWIEQPFRRSTRPPAQLLWRYALLTATMVCLCAGLRWSYGMLFRAPDLAHQEALVGSESDPCIVPDPATLPSVLPRCDDAANRPAVALWGDSHAAAVAPALRSRAQAQGYGFIEAAKTSCPPLQGEGRYYPADPDHAAACIDFNNHVLQRFAADPRVRIVVLAGAWSFSFWEPHENRIGWLMSGSSHAAVPSREATEQAFLGGLERSIDTLTSAGKRVVVLQDVPMLERDPFWRRRSVDLPVRRWMLDRLRYGEPVDSGYDSLLHAEDDRRVRGLIAAASASSGAAVFDLEDALCDSRAHCRYAEGDDLLFRDQQHLSYAGAESVLEGFRLPPLSVDR
jgi:peptidoglycan/LPS O-acetylase OafA/YrhL